MFSPGFHQVRQVWGANITEERVLVLTLCLVFTNVHVCACMYMHVYMWGVAFMLMHMEAEVSARYFSQFLSTLFLRQGLFPEVGALQFS